MNIINNIKEKINSFDEFTTDIRWSDWLNNNLDRVKMMFENSKLRDFIFEPFKGVFTAPIKTIDENIYSVITQVAIINAVLAGLPGKMGIGVFVSMALEAWMAYSIATHVGVKIKSPKDIAKYFGLVAGVAAVIIWGIKILLGFSFSLFSVIPGVNPLIIAELFVTNFIGILFWIGFQEVKRKGTFRIPKLTIKKSFTLTTGLFKHQMSILKNVFNMKNIKSVGEKLAQYLKGEIPIDYKVMNGELLPTVLMGYLISGHYDKLQGPLGEEFISAIRLRWSSQFNEDTTLEEISQKFAEYSPEQLEGAINTVKGKMFEILVEKSENSDLDKWKAKMHEDESFPGSDIVLTNEDGETMEISLKAVSIESKQIIEEALAKYPDMPIMTTDEMAKLYEDNPMVFGSGFANEELRNITEERFEELINKIQPIDSKSVVYNGVAISTAALLYPFTISYIRKKISYKQLTIVFEKVLKKQGLVLASRLSYSIVLGPIFAWYLLARGVKAIVSSTEPEINEKKYFVEYKNN